MNIRRNTINKLQKLVAKTYRIKYTLFCNITTRERATMMIYIVRDICGTNQPVFTFNGALRELALCGPDAAVFTVTGKWVAGRRVS